MTREDKLYSMKMAELVKLADDHGIKINKKGSKEEAVEKILLAEQINKENEKELKKEEAENDTHVINTEPKLAPMPGTQDPEWGKKHFNERDTEYLTKLTKKQQKIITKIYKGEDKLYHVTVDFNGTVTQLDDKNLSKIYLMINAIIKGEK